ncbi:nucleoside hydrolase [Pradoshia sp.]|uniref:nucleoside hydrolase n=1 Tax=Pradoshia sp. TaxID=2651281 RepID=UPI003F01C8A1
MKSIIVDVDTGIDDALAIAYAVHSPEIELLGLTTCFGNVTVEKATRNSRLVLEKLGRSDIPVYAGAGETLNRGLNGDFPHVVHGHDGLGNLIDEEPTDEMAHSDQHAVDYLIEQVKNKPGKITYICVGPLTNLALALQKAPEITALFEEVIIMGGAVYTKGNVTPHAEANIHRDPEAADFVFRSNLPLYLVGLDVTMQTLLPTEELKGWREKGEELGSFFADMTEFYIDFYKKANPGIKGCALHDPLAVGLAIDKSFVSLKPERLWVELEGEREGKTCPNAQGRPLVNVCVDVDEERFVKHFLSRVI